MGTQRLKGVRGRCLWCWLQSVWISVFILSCSYYLCLFCIYVMLQNKSLLPPNKKHCENPVENWQGWCRDNNDGGEEIRSRSIQVINWQVHFDGFDVWMGWEKDWEKGRTLTCISRFFLAFVMKWMVGPLAEIKNSGRTSWTEGACGDPQGRLRQPVNWEFSRTVQARDIGVGVLNIPGHN